MRDSELSDWYLLSQSAKKVLIGSIPMDVTKNVAGEGDVGISNAVVMHWHVTTARPLIRRLNTGVQAGLEKDRNKCRPLTRSGSPIVFYLLDWKSGSKVGQGS